MKVQNASAIAAAVALPVWQGGAHALAQERPTKIFDNERVWISLRRKHSVDARLLDKIPGPVRPTVY